MEPWCEEGWEVEPHPIFPILCEKWWEVEPHPTWCEVGWEVEPHPNWCEEWWEGKWNPTQTGVKRAGAVEGNSVENILLDTGCSKLLEGGAIAVQCVHGDTASAQVEVAVGGKSLAVTAAVSETLPMDVLLGTDVPEFGMLLGQNIVKHAEATAVTTCVQAKMRAEQEEDLDLRAGASVTGIAEPSLVGPEWMATFDDELFEGGRVRVRPSRSQKRAARRRHWEPTPEEVEAEHTPLEITPHAVDIIAGQSGVLQEADTSLDAARKAARDCPYSTGVGSDGPLGQQWRAGEMEGVLTPLMRLTNSTAHGLYEPSGSYIDDLVVFGETWAQQLEHLMRLRATKLGAKAKKCKFKMCVLRSCESTNISVCCWIRGEECDGLKTFAVYSPCMC